jgi:ABC-type antimicrobial peptide transport system permease subunit
MTVLQHVGAAMLCALIFILIGTVLGYLGGAPTRTISNVRNKER